MSLLKIRCKINFVFTFRIHNKNIKHQLHIISIRFKSNHFTVWRITRIHINIFIISKLHHTGTVGIHDPYIFIAASSGSKQYAAAVR